MLWLPSAKLYFWRKHEVDYEEVTLLKADSEAGE